MATVPSNQKFHTVPASVDTSDRGSARANADREIYTMQDIIDTVGGDAPPADKVYMTVYAFGNISSGYFCSFTTDINGNHYSADGYPFVRSAETVGGVNHTLPITGFNDTGATVPFGTTFDMLVQGPVIASTAGNQGPYGGLKWGDSLFYYIDFAGYIVDGYDRGLPPTAIALEDYGETGVGTNKIRCYVNPPTQYYQYPDRTKWHASTRIAVRTGAVGIADGSLLVSTNGASVDEPAVRQYDPSAGDVWADVIGLAPYALGNNRDFLMPILGEVGITPVISGGLGLKVYSDVTNPHLLTTVNTSGNFVGIISTDNGDGTYTVLFTPRS